MAKKSVYNEYNWNRLQQRLKQQVDKLARRRRSFARSGLEALDKRIETTLLNEDLFYTTKSGNIGKGLTFYKDKSITYLQRAVAELERFNNSKMWSSPKSYKKVITKRNESLKDYIREQLEKKGASYEEIERIVNQTNIVNELIAVMNENVNSKISSDKILSPLFDSYINLERNALNESLNIELNARDVTRRLYER
jgi:hypothetical protein